MPTLLIKVSICAMRTRARSAVSRELWDRQKDAIAQSAPLCVANDFSPNLDRAKASLLNENPHDWFLYQELGTLVLQDDNGCNNFGRRGKIRL